MTLRPSALDHRTAMRLAQTEYQRCLAQLRELGTDEWSAVTECPGWTVREVVAHLVGMVDMAASMRESRRQVRVAQSGAGRFIDVLTDLQVSEHAGWSPEQLLDRFAARAPAAVRSRRLTPRFVRGRSMGVPQDVGASSEDWSLGYLLDTILTRDPWMHRGDIARATGRPMDLTAEHDGVIVADIVAEWSGRHDKPFELVLTGPAGGRWSRGTGGERLEVDAVQFCRLLSERGEAAERVGLLGVVVPF
jgi:uncharacterized protein (TIGR03083 family)